MIQAKNILSDRIMEKNNKLCKTFFLPLILILLSGITALIHNAYAQQPTSFTLDFEEGNLRGWSKTGNAFDYQPTFGDNPTARHRGQPSNHQGNYWIGTYERFQGLRNQKPGDIQGDRPRGTLSSNAFIIPKGRLNFLIGGGSSFETRVELLVIDPIEGGVRVYHASGRNTETMHRVEWDITPYAGKQGRIRIVDDSSSEWGHINADAFRFSIAQEESNIQIPNVVSMTLESARMRLREFTLRADPINEKISDKETGIVIEQLPIEGTRVNRGASVELWVSVKREKPAARINPAQLEVVQGREAVFESLSTPEGKIEEFWSGPGGQNAVGRYFKVRTEQLNPDNYEIVLQIRDRNQQIDRAIGVLKVIPTQILPPDEEKIILNLRADPLSTEEGKTVHFSAHLRRHKENIQYRFVFGDGKIRDWSHEPNTVHIYETPGNFDAYVMAMTEGRIISKSENLTVEIKKPSSPLLYILIMGILLAAAAVYTFKRFRRFKTVVHVIPKADLGAQEIITSSSTALQYELRLKPVIDNGEKEISSENPIILSERREIE